MDVQWYPCSLITSCFTDHLKMMLTSKRRPRSRSQLCCLRAGSAVCSSSQAGWKSLKSIFIYQQILNHKDVKHSCCLFLTCVVQWTVNGSVYVMLEEKLLIFIIFIFFILMDPHKSEDSFYTCKDFRWFSPNWIGRSKRWMYLVWWPPLLNRFLSAVKLDI